MKVYHSLSENMLTVNMLLSVFFLSGVSADRCDGHTPTFVITTPKSIAALNGSCLQVPCSFTVQVAENDFNSGGQTSAAWIPSSRSIFDISQGFNNDQINITGNIKQRNCTTVFSDIKMTQDTEYFLRIEKGKFRGTGCSIPLQFTVQDYPEKPRIEPDLKDLKENQSVTVTCSAFTPCPHSPPELTWNLQQDSLRQTEETTDGTFSTKIQENITLSDTHDGYNISCSARYPVIEGNKTAETEVTLSVSYAPKDTSASISPSGLVSAGSWVELSCSSRAKPPPSFTWFRISEHGDINVSVGKVYSFNVTEGGKYYCVATNDLGKNRSSAIIVTIKGGTFSFWIALIASIAVILLICLVICVWCFKFKHPTPQRTQTRAETEVQMPDKKPEEEIHHGEVTFVPRRPEVSAVSVQDSGQQDLVYASVKVSADCSEDLYAQVKKK
ncbi:vascular cell adhesion protein 1-like [Gambusia affinis]|uniref:vascular cell adhesion protein 1-like n=1 Tax=Gambusia affinis TaxID=33528 RepID=UPI001CDB8A48|nr:vascular cell adhesion protein 1-like [Gambusia affinis]XP_043960085.1 vascular cell adhesion protein 1-like [Gambusia affinis]